MRPIPPQPSDAPDMYPEHMWKELHRNTSILQLVDIVNKIKKLVKIEEPHDLIHILQTATPEKLADILSRINGILTSTPILDRGTFQVGSQQSMTQMGTPELVFPPSEVRENLFYEYVTKLQSLFEADPEEMTYERVRFFIHNLIIYLHPFVDGNGRTARFCVGMLKNETEFQEASALFETTDMRKLANREYHHQLNQLAFQWLLYDRNISVDQNYPEPVTLMGDDYTTLDNSKIYFIALFDNMSEEERATYNQSALPATYHFDEAKIPTEIIDRAKVNMNNIRKNFTQKALDVSLGVHRGEYNQNVTPTWLFELFAKAV